MLARTGSGSMASTMAIRQLPAPIPMLRLAPRRPFPLSTEPSTLFAPIHSPTTTPCKCTWKSASHGLQFQVSYTYSHALDDASSASLGSLNNGDFRDQRFPRLEYGNSDFDVRHHFVVAYAYDFRSATARRLPEMLPDS